MNYCFILKETTLYIVNCQPKTKIFIRYLCTSDPIIISTKLIIDQLTCPFTKEGELLQRWVSYCHDVQDFYLLES